MTSIKWIGSTYGKVSIIREGGWHIYPSGKRRRLVVCKCKCGKVFKVLVNALVSGNTKSCGCYNIEKHYIHGLNKTRFQRIFNGIKNRCNNVNIPEYKYYGGRGIKCEWKDLIDFKKDMYECYLKHFKKHKGDTTIERINNDGNYCKENCTWKTQKENCQNRRMRYNIGIMFEGKKRTMVELSKKFNLTYGMFKGRYYRSGKNIDKMILKYNM